MHHWLALTLPDKSPLPISGSVKSDTMLRSLALRIVTEKELSEELHELLLLLLTLLLLFTPDKYVCWGVGKYSRSDRRAIVKSGVRQHSVGDLAPYGFRL